MLRLAPEGYYQICAGRDIMEQHTAAARQTWQFHWQTMDLDAAFRNKASGT